MQVHTSNIRVHTTKYDNMKVIYTNTLVVHECIVVINSKCTIFLLTFQFYMCAGHVVHTHASARKCHTSAYHTHAPHMCNTQTKVQSREQLRGETVSVHKDEKPIGIGE